MKKIITLICLIFFGTLCLINHTLPADAAKKTKSKISEATINELNEGVDKLTRKYYTRELYSPQDSDDLINLKLKLDNHLNTSPEPVWAPIYYKLGVLYNLRGMKNESISCHKTILENFGDTAFAPKAREALLDMGVEIKEEEPINEEELEEEF